MAYRKNPENVFQSWLEDMAYSSGIGIQSGSGKTRVYDEQPGTATPRTSGSGGGSKPSHNAGVSFPWDDKPAVFLSDTQGRA